MQIFDFLLLTAMTPVVCLILILFFDICSAHARARRIRALERYQPGLFSSPYAAAAAAAEKLMSGSRNA
jgi:hypothetical protein